MIDVQSPQAGMMNAFAGTSCPLKLIVALSGMKIAMSKRIIATALTVESCSFVDTLPEMALEQARPIIIRSQ
jgi:hypothetical protein